MFFVLFCSVIVNFSLILVVFDRRTDRRTDGPTDRRTIPLIEMRESIQIAYFRFYDVLDDFVLLLLSNIACCLMLLGILFTISVNKHVTVIRALTHCLARGGGRGVIQRNFGLKQTLVFVFISLEAIGTTSGFHDHQHRPVKNVGSLNLAHSCYFHIMLWENYSDTSQRGRATQRNDVENKPRNKTDSWIKEFSNVQCLDWYF